MLPAVHTRWVLLIQGCERQRPQPETMKTTPGQARCTFNQALKMIQSSVSTTCPGANKRRQREHMGGGRKEVSHKSPLHLQLVGIRKTDSRLLIPLAFL